MLVVIVARLQSLGPVAAAAVAWDNKGSTTFREFCLPEAPLGPPRALGLDSLLAAVESLGTASFVSAHVLIHCWFVVKRDGPGEGM